MIADRIAHLERYRGLDPRLDRGLEALARLAASPPAADGRQELEGQDLYAGLATYETGEPGGRSFEAHRRYIDIQAVLRGRELLYWAPLDGLAERAPYSEAEDLALYEDPPGGGTGLLLEPGAFVVLFAEDAHKPGCTPPAQEGGGGAVRKLVLKVRV